MRGKTIDEIIRVGKRPINTTKTLLNGTKPNNSHHALQLMNCLIACMPRANEPVIYGAVRSEEGDRRLQEQHGKIRKVAKSLPELAWPNF